VLACTDARGEEVLIDEVNGGVAHVSRRPDELA